MARPREFDTHDALMKALTLFWRNGYEGTSITDLTGAMCITRPSLYAAFGNKADLFRKAMGLYERTYLGFAAEALDEPTAYRVVERLLEGHADLVTAPCNPSGCFGINGALACSEEGADIQRDLVARRRFTELALQDRLDRAVREGDLPAGVVPSDLAHFITTVTQGMAVQAKAGATRQQLTASIRMALRLMAPTTR
ncbi:TetR/AcrR family transcriptional regulator [Lichenihabitans psoromatis]|uniref:TetR/AcrR family transcriptional regulator n=1 Tax=Lichenihabitans psoromatis TaxID=2528642 RepID=UPI001036E317|nr:TetR/AcrR family transcriptional regulator [Lichenihabitans psoromatis]